MYMTDVDDVIIEAEGAEEGGSEAELEEVESQIDSKLTKVKQELEKVKKEKQEYLDGWQRAKADYVNALKRFEDEKKGSIEFGKIISVRAFIPVLDSLTRAEQAGEIPEAFQAIAKQLHDAIKQLGLAPFGSIGDTFDPLLHEALGQDPVDSKEKDETVTVVLENGWKSGEVVIRPAKVRVGTFA